MGKLQTKIKIEYSAVDINRRLEQLDLNKLNSLFDFMVFYKSWLQPWYVRRIVMLAVSYIRNLIKEITASRLALVYISSVKHWAFLVT
jgi:hypothetical protein